MFISVSRERGKVLKGIEWLGKRGKNLLSFFVFSEVVKYYLFRIMD